VPETSYAPCGDLSLAYQVFGDGPVELRVRAVLEVGEDYAPSVEQIVGFQRFGRAVKSAWGTGEAAKCLIPSVRSMRLLGMLERMSASPGMARATLEAAFSIDTRPILPTIDRKPRGAVAVTTCLAHRVVHRHRRIDRTRGRDG
jgi:hypothetical protein